jgi:outer membrane biosynthesis protein TonB
MTEVLFILTTIFVAYVAYALVSEQKAAAKTQAPIAQPEKKVVAEEQAKPKAVATKAKPAPAKAAAPKAAVAPKPVATKAAAPKATVKPAETKAAAPKVAAKKAATAATAHAAGLKDPKTGEVAKTYSNYRFTKRWIKDALVAEGLLDKVYATNELDTATEAKIKSAIEQLESMPKYQA